MPHEERLKLLAEFLETLPDERQFKMWTWGYHEGDHPPADNNYCGTAACVLGWAAMIPSFKREGLEMQWNRSRKDDAYVARVIYGSLMDEQAGRVFFDLTEQQTADLFFGDFGTAGEAARFIRDELLHTTT